MRKYYRVSPSMSIDYQEVWEKVREVWEYSLKSFKLPAKSRYSFFIPLQLAKTAAFPLALPLLSIEKKWEFCPQMGYLWDTNEKFWELKNFTSPPTLPIYLYIKPVYWVLINSHFCGRGKFREAWGKCFAVLRSLSCRVYNHFILLIRCDNFHSCC